MAMNGNPELNDYVGLEIFGTKSKYLFGDSIDLDFTALYSSILRAFNIFATAMIGKLIIDMDAEGFEFLKLSMDGEDPGKDFVEDYLIGDILHLMTKWFDGPEFEQVYKIVMEKLGGQI